MSDDKQSLLNDLLESPGQAMADALAEANGMSASVEVSGAEAISEEPAPMPAEPAPADAAAEAEPAAEDLAAILDSLPEGTDPAAAAGAEPLAEEAAMLDALLEGENPTAGVDEMLSEALADIPVPEPSSGPSSALPQFQLRLFFPKGMPKDAAKKIAADLAIPPNDAIWAAESPLVSQLTEYQAIRFAQALRLAGISVSMDVKHPGSLPSEEELALGNLAGVEESAVKTEGAPSVMLPGNEKNVLLYSGENFPGFPVQQSLGMVTAHRSLARRLFREEEMAEKMRKELSIYPGRTAANLPSSRLEGIFRELFLDLQKSALRLGGNAVLGLEIEAFPESSNLDPSLEQMRLVAFGTAAVVEKSEI